MPAHVSTHPNRGNTSKPRGKSPWGYVFSRRSPEDVTDEWVIRDRLVRRRLLLAARGTNRKASLTALDELYRLYQVRLPLIEAHWKRLGARERASSVP